MSGTSHQTFPPETRYNEYQIFTMRISNADEFNEFVAEVSFRMAEGWQPVGGVRQLPSYDGIETPCITAQTLVRVNPNIKSST